MEDRKGNSALIHNYFQLLDELEEGLVTGEDIRKMLYFRRDPEKLDKYMNLGIILQELVSNVIMASSASKVEDIRPAIPFEREYSVSQIAKILMIERQTVSKWINKGYTKEVGGTAGKYLIKEHVIEEYLKETSERYYKAWKRKDKE